MPSSQPPKMPPQPKCAADQTADNEPLTETRSADKAESIVPSNRNSLSTRSADLAERGLRDLLALDTANTGRHRADLDQQPGETTLEWTRRVQKADPKGKFRVKEKNHSEDLPVPCSSDTESLHPIEELARRKFEEAFGYPPDKTKSAIVLLLICFEDQIDFTIPREKDHLMEFILYLDRKSPEEVLEVLRPVIGDPDGGFYSMPIPGAFYWSPLKVANFLEEDVHHACLHCDTSYCPPRFW